MRAVGIIAEYNPFHNGHEYQLEKAKEISGADIAVSVISGNFTQRGEIAVSDKWERAEMAIAGGVDLVVELPFLFACNNAGFFARGGVEILENLAVSHIAFGSESGDLERLKNIAGKLADESGELDKSIRELVRRGLSFPRARAEAIGEKGFDEPNDVLAAEYIKNIKNATPIAVKREGAGHNDLLPSGSTASATFIREALIRGEDISPYVPETTLAILKRAGNTAASDELIFSHITSSVLRAGASGLRNIFGAEEGLGEKLYNEIRNYKNYDEMVEGLKSKRYTRTRVKRVIIHTLFGITREDVLNAENYVRILALNDRGAKYIKQLKKSEKCRLPVISNLGDALRDFPHIKNTLDKDILASDIYNLVTKKDMYESSDYVKKTLKY